MLWFGVSRARTALPTGPTYVQWNLGPGNTLATHARSHYFEVNDL